MNIKEVVKEKHALAALRAASGGSSCCRAEATLKGSHLTVSNLYDESELSRIPPKAICAWLGCGNPPALAKLKPGETVLDLGSGGGMDALLSALRVGLTGKVYGLDNTEEMIALARENQQEARIWNIDFLKGEIESIPLQQNSVDVVISNYVINLSENKDRVFLEAFRVLRPGGRLAISDVVVTDEVPAEIRRRIELWLDCVAGTLEASQYRSRLTAAGFEEIEIEPIGTYCVEGALQALNAQGADADSIAHDIEGKYISAFIRATKPSSF